MSTPSPDPAPPSFYDDLDATRVHALGLLARGVKDRRSAMHTFTVATLGLDGAPRQRTVVNRGFDATTRTLRFHTDSRSAKLAELARDPRAGVHVYDPRAKIQLRLDTVATVHRDDRLRDAAWQATRPFSRVCYRVVPAPGERVADPGSVPFEEGASDDTGVENFVAVTLRIEALEWLYLAHQGHRRARFRWLPDGTVQQDWLVP